MQGHSCGCGLKKVTLGHRRTEGEGNILFVQKEKIMKHKHHN